MTSIHRTALVVALVEVALAPAARADGPKPTERDKEIALALYAPNMTSADVGSDGTPASPLFIVDEKTPHALMIVPVSAPGGAGHSHAAAR